MFYILDIRIILNQGCDPVSAVSIEQAVKANYVYLEMVVNRMWRSEEALSSL